MHDFVLEHPRAMLFCGMGISKTAALYWAINSLLLDAAIRGVLVVAPLRVCNLTWPMEAKQWQPFQWMRVANLRTSEGIDQFMAGTADVYVCNYEFLPSLTKLIARRKGGLPYDVEVWDESTRAKNHGAKRINGYRKGPRGVRRVALTGTPTPHSLLDLFAQVRLIDDGARLGRSFTHFRDTYFTSDFMGYKWEPKEGAEVEIYAKIADITLTLKTRDWVDLPEPIIEDVEVALPEEVMKQYRKLEKDLILQLPEGEINAANAAVLVQKLQQFTAGQSYDAERTVHAMHDEKVQALGKLAKQHDEPLLVACIFQHEQAALRAAYPLAVFFADAKTPAAQENMLNAWNRGDIPMLVAHPASVGHGLNLQRGGCKLVYMSLTFNREYYEQMICRLSRRGQTKPVTVYRLMCPGTVDEAVAEALADKANIEHRLLGWLTNKQNERTKP